jgi:hypothetical protein
LARFFLFFFFFVADGLHKLIDGTCTSCSGLAAVQLAAPCPALRFFPFLPEGTPPAGAESCWGERALGGSFGWAAVSAVASSSLLLLLLLLLSTLLACVLPRSWIFVSEIVSRRATDPP